MCVTPAPKASTPVPELPPAHANVQNCPVQMRTPLHARAHTAVHTQHGRRLSARPPCHRDPRHGLDAVSFNFTPETKFGNGLRQRSCSQTMPGGSLSFKSSHPTWLPWATSRRRSLDRGDDQPRPWHSPPFRSAAGPRPAAEGNGARLKRPGPEGARGP